MAATCPWTMDRPPERVCVRNHRSVESLLIQLIKSIIERMARVCRFDFYSSMLIHHSYLKLHTHGQNAHTYKKNAHKTQIVSRICYLCGMPNFYMRWQRSTTRKKANAHAWPNRPYAAHAHGHAVTSFSRVIARRQPRLHACHVSASSNASRHLCCASCPWRIDQNGHARGVRRHKDSSQVGRHCQRGNLPAFCAQNDGFAGGYGEVCPLVHSSRGPLTQNHH